MKVEFKLTPAQTAFLQDTTTRNLAFIGGFGSGKSFGGALKALQLAQLNPQHDGIIAGPNMGIVRDTVAKQFEVLLKDCGILHHYNRSLGQIKLQLPGAKVPSTIYIKSAHDPSKLVGLNAAWFVFDEIDIMHPEEARSAWNNLNSRLGRVHGQRVQACACTTPEGYGFAYQYFVMEPRLDPQVAESRRMIQADTRDSAHVPDDAIRQIFQNYTPQQARAYVAGEFVNFNSGSVYSEFDRTENASPLMLRDLPEEEPLYVGIDFNIGGMSAVVIGGFGENKLDELGRFRAQRRYVIVDEKIGAQNTADMIDVLKTHYKGRKVIVCPDTSGKARHTSANQTDLSLLKQAGYELKYDAKAPPIRDRVNTVNARFCNAEGERKLFVNTSAAPLTTKCLEQQAYDEVGLPQKGIKIDNKTKTFIDGPVDALGYAMWQIAPVRTKPTARVYR